jgi:hypothetical protein
MSSKVRRARGVFEDDALVIALAIAFRFGAINAYWSFFATLDPTLSACCLQLVRAHQGLKCYWADKLKHPVFVRFLETFCAGRGAFGVIEIASFALDDPAPSTCEA